MPLSFQRPPRSVFSPKPARVNKPNEEHHTQEQNDEKPTDNLLNFYPLQPDEQQKQPNERRGAKPVNPLPLPKSNPLTTRRQNPLQQPLQNPPMRPYVPQLPQPTAEDAAEQFRRINRNLPDGVVYEPIDEETMRILKAAKPATAPKAAPQKQQAVQPPSPTAPTISSEIAKTIKKLAQDEHNAQIFYTDISFNAPSEEIKQSLTEMAKDCKLRHKKYTQLLKSHFDTDFVPAVKKLNTSLSFPNAIYLAISEENKALVTLGSLLDQVEGTTIERQIERIISKKILGHQLLLSYSHFIR
ncbi:MAG: ferritin-like domain-containing protein [Firmicutes bacterium]|nr:ferritin-like domain-containing protein [Bacillota bacterium]